MTESGMTEVRIPHLKSDVGQSGMGAARGGEGSVSGGHAVGESADHGIALTGGTFKAFAVKDVDVAALVFDQADALERACRHGDGGAARAEHFGEELLRDVKLIVLNSVSQHQEPAGEPLFHLVQAVAGYELAEDQGLGLNAVLNGLAQRLQALKIAFEIGKRHAHGGAGNLHKAAAGHTLAAAEVHALGHPFPGPHTGLYRAAVFHRCNDGCDARGKEMRKFRNFMRLVDGHADGKRDRGEFCAIGVERRWERIQDVVGQMRVHGNLLWPGRRKGDSSGETKKREETRKSCVSYYQTTLNTRKLRRMPANLCKIKGPTSPG